LNLPNHKTNHDFIYIPWYNLLAWVNEQEKIQNVQNDNDNDDVNYETFTIDKNSSNQQYIMHNFKIDYQQRFVHFNFLHPYEFSIKTNKINNICCHRFNSEHPQYNTHSIYKFKVQKILVLQCYTIHSQKNDLQNYTRAFCILFTSWHTIFDIKLDIIISWEITF